ncbi:phenylalanyl-tRNA synthetase subunit alpha [Klebsiella pneumoniae subsp. rhinoscleromatis]|nr:phenylalanyl-tRNA synthetase subunit alpha [Klebsiella pneumoniae subsp. rhinoscleromatis]
MSHLAELVASAKAAINEASDVAALDNVRVEYLGKKGHLTLQMTTLRELPAEERPGSRCGHQRGERAGAAGAERA